MFLHPTLSKTPEVLNAVNVMAVAITPLVIAVINSDGWTGYHGLVDVGYDKHYRVNHGNNRHKLFYDVLKHRS